MLAGDYLSYKGDWVTNTAYNVNECVTWTDGHLYQVIKAHTSSDTLAPSNTEYYKAMTSSTAGQISTRSFTSKSQLYTFIDSLQYEQIKYLLLNMSGTQYIVHPQINKTNYSSTVIYSNDGAIRHVMLTLWPSNVNSFYVDVAVDGARTITNFNVSNYTVYYEE